jgi:Putative regulator of cell autolysis
MNEKFSEHTSSLGDLPANTVVLMVWLGAIVLNIIFPRMSYLGLLVPLAFLLLEKKSPLVRAHAGQALALYIVVNILAVIMGIVFGIVFATSVAATTVIGSGAGTIFSFAGTGVVGIISLVLFICQVVFVIIACVKGHKWEAYNIPLINNLGQWLTAHIKIS